jgi:hypothetical protein
MPRKANAHTDRAAEAADYRAWKAHAAALLERQGILPGVMREKDWRQLYIRGKAPEDAARQGRWQTPRLRSPTRGGSGSGFAG